MSKTNQLQINNVSSWSAQKKMDHPRCDKQSVLDRILKLPDTYDAPFVTCGIHFIKVYELVIEISRTVRLVWFVSWWSNQFVILSLVV